MPDKVTLPKLQIAFINCWSKDTSADPDGWTSENPGWGQCAVTTLVAQDYFGGEIFCASLEEVPGFEAMRSHYWNELPDGTQRDFSQSQFPADTYRLIPQGEQKTREYLISNQDTERRYNVLRRKVAHFLKGD